MRAKVISVVLFVSFWSGAASADDVKLKATALGILARHAESLVTVKLVLRRRFVSQGQERGNSEFQTEIRGTMISPGGLTVVSDSESDPWSMHGPMGGDAFKADTETTDVKLVLTAGREIPAKFVLRDRDLDLAFLQPEESGLILPFVDLKKARVPAPLDDLIFLYRAGKSLNREACVSLGRVQAVLKKPRTMIVSDWINSVHALGSPVFDDSGTLVGLVILRKGPTSQTYEMSLRPLDTITPVILTAADLSAVAAEAAKAKPGPTAPAAASDAKPPGPGTPAAAGETGSAPPKP